jgi:hypothetical protein
VRKLVISDQLLIGGVTAAICAAGLWNQAWLLAETPKGRRLVGWCGEAAAPWVLRLLLSLGLGFGLLLACGVINPVRPASTPAGVRN